MSPPPFRLARVELGSARWYPVEVSPADQVDYIGGASLGARLLYPHLTRALDPLSPQAPLLFLCGPLTGTTGPTVGRAVFCGKSPATGLWAESNIGGNLGAELRTAGLDGLWITGRSSEPCYLWVHDGQIEVRGAGHLWGVCDTRQTQDRIRIELEDPLVRVGVIGAGGETQLPFASILCDHGRVAGRTGLGAVMGSKNLKAIAVRGRQPIPLADEAGYRSARSTLNAQLRQDNMSRAMRGAGTASGLDYWNYLGSMPSRYYTRGGFEGAEKVSGNTMAETILTGVSACHGCVIACGRVVSLDDKVRRKGPEYETIVGFGPSLGVDDLHAITRMSGLCDAYGMDTISLSNTLGLGFLLFEQGIITARDTGGLELTWGNAQAAEQLIHQTARREGFGARLALGARALARHYGVPELAAQVHGLEMAYHDPRGASGMALVYTTSPRGACHNQSEYYFVDTLSRADDEAGVDVFPRQAGPEKALSVSRHQDATTLRNALVMCIFANVATSDIVRLLNLATGADYTLDGMLRAGERAWTMKRAINIRLGLSMADERLPDHLLKPFLDGGSAGYTPPVPEMLAAYYAARGWDPVTGKPLPETLSRLGLQDVLHDLWPAG